MKASRVFLGVWNLNVPSSLSLTHKHECEWQSSFSRDERGSALTHSLCPCQLLSECQVVIGPGAPRLIIYFDYLFKNSNLKTIQKIHSSNHQGHCFTKPVQVLWHADERHINRALSSEKSPLNVHTHQADVSSYGHSFDSVFNANIKYLKSK